MKIKVILDYYQILFNSNLIELCDIKSSEFASIANSRTVFFENKSISRINNSSVRFGLHLEQFLKSSTAVFSNSLEK